MRMYVMRLRKDGHLAKLHLFSDGTLFGWWDNSETALLEIHESFVAKDFVEGRSLLVCGRDFVCCPMLVCFCPASERTCSNRSTTRCTLRSLSDGIGPVRKNDGIDPTLGGCFIPDVIDPT